MTGYHQSIIEIMECLGETHAIETIHYRMVKHTRTKELDKLAVGIVWKAPNSAEHASGLHYHLNIRQLEICRSQTHRIEHKM